jgi:acetolactate synthase-1/2/3 large subunit
VKLAYAYYAVGIRIEKKADVEGVLIEAVKTKKPYLLDFVVNPEENVTPMVPAGAPLDKMISSKEDADKFLLA